jgi:urea ABC transporter permease protein UrtB
MCDLRSASGLRLLWVLLALVFAAGPVSAQELAPVSKEIIDALKSLKTADEASRQKVYNLVNDKGDARLIPALKAYKDGFLQLRDDRLVIFGDRVNLPGKGSVLPLIDALTAEPIKGDDKLPIYLPKPDLSKAMKAPPRVEKIAISELISSLSLLDPNPETRIASIRDVAERAARAFLNPDDEATCRANLARFVSDHKASAAILPELKELSDLVTAALAARPARIGAPVPSEIDTPKIRASIQKAQGAKALPPEAKEALAVLLTTIRAHQDRIDNQSKVIEDLTKSRIGLQKQLDKNPKGKFEPALSEAIASIDAAIASGAPQQASISKLGQIGTSRAANLLKKIVDASKETLLHNNAVQALSAADSHQTRIHFVQNTFAGTSLGSILVLLALGLSIIFGLMGVINMAHGEFMMVGAFTTYVVSEAFKKYAPGAYDWYILAAIPAAFLVAGGIGWLCEVLVIRHLYGRPLETLLATWGIGIILIQTARRNFGDTLSVTPPKWMEGGFEVVPDLVFPLNRVYIILFCVCCMFLVYFVVNRTKLGLLLRATTQNRQMASALGVATRRIDAVTFAFGAGLAGLAGVAVPLYNKINPSIGQEYIVDSFMVVVVGGVGKLAGAIIAGFGLGFFGKYLEPLLQQSSALASSASVIGKVVVLGFVVIFLQYKPAGLFPPKGRVADA